MKEIVLITLILLTNYSTFGQNFRLAEPNTSELKEQLKDENNEAIYCYLIDNYKPTTQKENIEYYDWDSKKICSFTQVFENNIKYSIWQCKEAKGVSIIIELPKTDQNELKKWIEKINQVLNSDSEENVWKGEDTRFEPIEANPGCYYKIEEREKTTIIDIYCGC